MANKKTKREFYGELRELVGGNAELVAFIDHELELLDKKSSSKTPTKTQQQKQHPTPPPQQKTPQNKKTTPPKNAVSIQGRNRGFRKIFVP